MRKKIFFVIVFLCSIILIINYGSQLTTEMFGLKPRAGLKITAQPEAVVYFNGIEAGKTPYQDDNLSAGEYLVKLTSGDSSWQGRIKLTKGTVSNINRLLSPSIASSSGESLVLDKGSGIIITSDPSSTEVLIDGKAYGLTPLSASTLLPGEHNITFSHEGYIKRNINVILPSDLALYINVDLAMAEVKLSNVPVPTIIVAQKVRIKQTPLGYLRVREKPSASSREVGQVLTGNEMLVIEEVPGWVKIELKDGKAGYISTQYTEKVT